MNFLAHLLLSQEDDAETRLGNMLADFVKGPARKRLSPAMRKGIELHQLIDGFTDTHPVFFRSKDRISEPNRRFAAVLIDLFYDHFLSLLWDDYCDTPRDKMIGDFYAELPPVLEKLPSRAAFALRLMTKQDWLSSYDRIEGIELALARMSRRLDRPGLLEPCARELVDNHAALEADFTTYFPDLVRCVKRWRVPADQPVD